MLLTNTIRLFQRLVGSINTTSTGVARSGCLIGRPGTCLRDAYPCIDVSLCLGEIAEPTACATHAGQIGLEGLS